MALSDYARLDPSGVTLELGEGRSADGTPQVILSLDGNNPDPGYGVAYSLDAEAAVNLALQLVAWSRAQLPDEVQPGHYTRQSPREQAEFAYGFLTLASAGLVDFGDLS